MLSEFVEKIVALVTNASKAEFKTHETLNKVFVSQGGSYTTFDIPPLPRGGILQGLDDLVLACRDTAIAPAPEIYHQPDMLVVLLDREDRHERLALGLNRSALFRTVTELERNAFTQRDLIRTLRIKLGLGSDHPVLKAIRRVDFRRRNDGSSVVERGKESLGRAVEMEVQSAEDIPEHFDLTMPVYANPGIRNESETTVRLHVDIDIENETFWVGPVADALEIAMQAVHMRLAAILRDQLPGVQVFFGRP